MVGIPNLYIGSPKMKMKEMFYNSKVDFDSYYYR